MRRLLQKGFVRRLFRATLAVALTALVIAGSLGTWEVRGEQDSRDLARLTDGMKTHCIGRFLIDMPAEAQIEIGQARVSGFDVGAVEETREEFLQRLADRETQIRAKPDQGGGNQNLESVRELKTDNGTVGRMFVHSRKVIEGTRANGLELERYRNEGVALEALVHGAGISIDLSAEYYDPAQIEELPKLVAQLVPNPDNKISGKAGFCIGRAYIRDPLTADQGEQITMSGAIPTHPDLRFMLILSAGLKPDAQGLLERSRESNSKLFIWQRMRISEIRAAPRKIAGLPGEELVRSFDEENDARVHSFWWEVNGTEDNVLIPHLVLKMNTGINKNVPIPSSLSEHTALGLWDRILSSIRLQASAQPHRGTDARISSTAKLHAVATRECNPPPGQPRTPEQVQARPASNIACFS